MAPRIFTSVSLPSLAADQDVSVIRAANFGTAEAEPSNNSRSNLPELSAFFLVGAREPRLQGQRISHRMSALVIVEVDIDCPQSKHPLADEFSPGSQHPLGVIALILTGRSMKAEVSVIGRQLRWRALSLPIMDTQSHVVLSKEIVNSGRVPSWIPEFADVSML